MKTALLFLHLQIKKYGKRLPLILLESILFAGIVLAAGSYGAKALYGEKTIADIKIGIVSKEESSITQLLVNFVGSMESFEESCHFELLEEEEGKKALKSGEIYAAVLLPEGILDSILDGTNLPAQIVLNQAYSSMETAVFAEVAKAGNRLLSVAQAGIYAADALCRQLGREELIPEAESFLNEAYLKYALERNALFKMQEIKAGGKTGPVAYYAMSFLLVFFSFVGVLLGKYATVEPTMLSWVLRKNKQGYFRQYLAEAGAFAGVFAFFGTILGLPVLIFAMKAENRGMPQPGGILLFFFVLAALGAFIRLLTEITGKEAGGLLLGLCLLFVMMFVSGLMLPTAFLPVFIGRIGKAMPYALWQMDLIAIVEKENSAVQLLIQIILLMGCLFAGAVIFALKAKGMCRVRNNMSAEELLEKQKMASVGMSRRQKTDSGVIQRKKADSADAWPAGLQMLIILGKQYLIKYRLWFGGLLFISLLLSVTGGIDKEQETAGILVGVYAEDSDGLEVFERLSEEDGIFRFLLFEQEAEMLRQVENKTLECAYSFRDGFFENMKKGKVKRQVDLFYSPGAGAHKLSYEVVFSHLFAMLSEPVLEEWLTDFAGLDGAGADVVSKTEQELLDLKALYETNGSTFSFTFENGGWGEEQRSRATLSDKEAQKESGIDPVRGCIAVLVFFMALLGLGNCCDLWEKAALFQNKEARRIRGCSLFIAVSGAIISGLVLLCVAGCLKKSMIGSEICGLICYGVILLVYLWILRFLLKTSERIYGVLPVLLIGSLVFGPVLIQMKAYLPLAGIVEVLFPTTWYLRLMMLLLG